MEVILELTGGIGVDRAIDAVGVDCRCTPHHGPARQDGATRRRPSSSESSRKWRRRRTRRGQLACRATRRPRRSTVGGGCAGQGRHAVHHRRVPADDAHLPDRPGDEQEPHDQRWATATTASTSPPAGAGARRGAVRPDGGPLPRRAADERHRGLPRLRRAQAGLDEGGGSGRPTDPRPWCGWMPAPRRARPRCWSLRPPSVCAASKWRSLHRHGARAPAPAHGSRMRHESPNSCPR